MKSLDSTDDYVEFYLDKLKAGELEMAFHALAEIGHSIIPKLIDAFQKESAPIIRSELVRIIWSYRRPETVSFLGEALFNSSSEVWKCALDGLVTIATPGALAVLKRALTRSFADKKMGDCFRNWVEEAIEQVEKQLANK